MNSAPSSVASNENQIESSMNSAPSSVASSESQNETSMNSAPSSIASSECQIEDRASINYPMTSTQIGMKTKPPKATRFIFETRGMKTRKGAKNTEKKDSRCDLDIEEFTSNKL